MPIITGGSNGGPSSAITQLGPFSFAYNTANITNGPLGALLTPLSAGTVVFGVSILSPTGNWTTPDTADIDVRIFPVGGAANDWEALGTTFNMLSVYGPTRPDAFQYGPIGVDTSNEANILVAVAAQVSVLLSGSPTGGTGELYLYVIAPA